MSKTYLLTYGGGFGDVLLSYLILETGYIKALKEREPDCKIRVAIMSHNPVSRSIFEHHPLIDEILYEDWNENRKKEFFRQTSEGCVTIESPGLVENFGLVPGSVQCCASTKSTELHLMLKDLTYEQPTIYLIPEEQKIADDIVSCGKFVAFHPFGGYLPRSWQGKVDIKKVIDDLCDVGVRVILLGGSSDRITDHKQRLIEEFDYERPGLVNLVNKHSMMLHSYVCSKADKFIGTMSCYNCVAVAYKIPILFLTIQGDESHMCSPITDQWAGITNLLKKSRAQVYFFGKLPADLTDKIVTFCTTN